MELSILDAIEALYEELCSLEEIRLGRANLFEDYAAERLAEHKARNGRPVLWYIDERHNIAVYVDTAELLTDEEIEDQLC